MFQWAYEVMAHQCPKTCNRCHGEIVDMEESCSFHRADCENPATRDLMSWQCPHTCGWTESTRPRPSGRLLGTAPPGCQDSMKWVVGASTGLFCPCTVRYHFSCQAWVANGFCKNTWYTVAMKKQHCALSCGLCAVTVS